MVPSILPYVPQVNWFEITPFVILVLGGLIVLALDAVLDLVIKGITPRTRDLVLTWVTGGALFASGIVFYGDALGATGTPSLEGMFRGGSFGSLGCLIILFAAICFVIMAPALIQRRRLPAGELYALLLFATTGMTMLTVANELITAFICIEILSLSLYAMAGIDRRSLLGGEAAFKYFILGAFASAFLVMGIAFIFGATGTTQLVGNGAVLDQMMAQDRAGQIVQLPTDELNYNLGLNEVLYAGERIAYVGIPTAENVDGRLLQTIERGVRTVELNPIWIFIGFAMIFVGLAFKLSLAPFHMWAPDVYEGAPTIVSMLIATASKVAAFAFLVHLIEAMSTWKHFPLASGFLLSSVAVISIVWGNLAAIVQTNIKRMLAYSSIAHGGYLAIGIAVLVSPEVFSNLERIDRVRDAILFYLFGYTLMNVLAFGAVAYLGKDGEGTIGSYRGLFKRRPGVAFGISISMISLIGLGIPGTVGFWGKFLVFKEAMDASMYALAILAMIGSAVSAYYYLRVTVAMFMRDQDEALPMAGADHLRPFGYHFVLILSSVLIFLFGFFPMLFLSLGGGL